MPLITNRYSGTTTGQSPYSTDSYGPAPYSRAWIAATKVNGVAGCMSWAPENRREITITRKNDNYHDVRYAHQPTPPRRCDGQFTSMGSYMEPEGIANNVTTQATQTTTRDAVVAQAVDDGFTHNVIDAIHNPGDLQRMNEYNNYAPRPPTGKSSSQKYGFVNNRRVLIADPCDGRRSSMSGRPRSPPLVVVRPNTGYVRPDIDVTCDHHRFESHPSSTLGGRSKSCLHLHQPISDDYNHQQVRYADSYPTQHFDGRSTVARYDKSHDFQHGVGYDVTKQQQQQLFQLREAAAEERKKLMSIYQKVKSDEKFIGPAPWRDHWHRMTSSGMTTENEATEQAVALAESQERLAQLLDKREQLQRRYVSNQQLARSLSSSSLRSRCTSPFRGTTAAERYNDSAMTSAGSGDGLRYVTVYNPGRSTPVGSYYATDSNRPLTYYHTASGGQQMEEGNNQVNLKVECQPNTDTVLSLRVQSRQV